jgi:membrane-associated protease RseP (regulator of RpoE activity)
MKSRIFSVRRLMLLVFGLFICVSLLAQQPTYLLPVNMKDEWLRGSIAIAQHENDGMIGISGGETEAGYKVASVLPGGPGANAGILPGDVIVALDGAPTKGPDAAEALMLVTHKKEGETVKVTYVRNGETRTVSVTVALRKNVMRNDPAWQQESKYPPTVGQMVFGGTGQVMANLALTDRYPNDVILNVSVANKGATAFSIDDAKFFVLDGTGQQLRHVSLEEIKYAIQLQVARNWRGGNYPPPPLPSPQKQYTISGVENGNYTITNLGGGMGSISGTSSSTYSVTQQPDFNQLGYSLGLAIRRHLDTKSNEKLLEQSRAAFASWEGSYFSSQSPVLPGEERKGGILYWTGSDRRPQPPFRVVLFLTDPRTQKEENATFAFGPGADTIKEELANRSAPASSQAKAATDLTNTDIVGMFKAGVAAEIIVAKIKNSSCSFDTSPAALEELRRLGVPDSVVLAMVQAPKN